MTTASTILAPAPASALPPSTANDASDAVVRVAHLAHRYPRADTPALDDVSLHVQRGEIFGLLGPNGSGKTTLFRILSTSLTPQRPHATKPAAAAVAGHDLFAHPAAVRQNLGVIFQNPSIDPKLTANENLTHGGRLYGLTGANLRQRIEHALATFSLADRKHEPVERFSGGMRRRLELAKALLHQPRVLIMDEPSTGLDPAARRDLWRHLHELRQRTGVTVLLTTHLMDEADRCDRLAILCRGRLVATDTPDRLKARVGGQVVTVTPPPRQADADQLLRTIQQQLAPFPTGGEPQLIDNTIRFETDNPTLAVQTLHRDAPGRFRTITLGQPTLEDAYLHLTGQTFNP